MLVFLLAAAKLLAMDDAAWQPLLPQAPKGAQVASVHAGATLSQTLLRIPKESARWYQRVIAANSAEVE